MLFPRSYPLGSPTYTLYFYEALWVVTDWAAMDAKVGRKAPFSHGHILLSENGTPREHVSVKVTSWEGEGRTQKSCTESDTQPSGWVWDEGLAKTWVSFILKVTKWLKALRMGYHSAPGGERSFLEFPMCAWHKGGFKKSWWVSLSGPRLLRTMVSPQPRAGGKESCFIHL